MESTYSLDVVRRISNIKEDDPDQDAQEHGKAILGDQRCLVTVVVNPLAVHQHSNLHTHANFSFVKVFCVVLVASGEPESIMMAAVVATIKGSLLGTRILWEETGRVQLIHLYRLCYSLASPQWQRRPTDSLVRKTTSINITTSSSGRLTMIQSAGL